MVVGVSMKITFRRLLLSTGAAVGGAGILAVVLFLPAGRWDLLWFWAYIIVYGLFAFCGFLFLDAGLLKERLRPGPEARDRVTVALTKGLSMVQYVVAGLDVGRYRWSGDVPAILQGAALIVVALCAVVTVWSMAINPFFSTVVRIQEERGHRVVSTGPYRVVRHPGYAVIAVLVLANAVALGSWWALVPGVTIVLLLLRRTVLEDAFLHRHLEGYAEYARQARYRLIPGVW